jgi:2-aminoadipate transaminase
MKAHALSALARRTEEPPISWLMATALAQPHMISLAAGFTDNETLPVKEVRGLLEEILRSSRTGQAALQYGTTAGDATLRELTTGHLQSLDGQRSAGQAYSSERMILTNGSQQMLYMVTEALCDPGDIVLVEDPSYFVYLGILQSHGVRARGVTIEKDGLDLGRLEAVLEDLKRSGELSRVKLLYLVSYYQNPTGRTTSFPKKTGALKLLRQYERAAGHPI